MYNLMLSVAMLTEFQYNAYEEESETMKRKVIRGGSWKDVAYFLQLGARDYEYQDTAKSYIGFRTVQSFLGRDLKTFNNNITLITNLTLRLWL